MRKAGDLPDLKAALDVAQRDYDDGLKAQELRDRHGRLRIELAWAHCGDKEKVSHCSVSNWLFAQNFKIRNCNSVSRSWRILTPVWQKCKPNWMIVRYGLFDSRSTSIHAYSDDLRNKSTRHPEKSVTSKLGTKKHKNESARLRFGEPQRSRRYWTSDVRSRIYRWVKSWIDDGDWTHRQDVE